METRKLTEADINSLTAGYKGRGLSEEMIELAIADLEYGLPQDKVDEYMTKGTSLELAKAISEAYHSGATEKLVKRFKNLDKHQTKIVLDELKGGLSEEKILEVISKKATAHDMEQMFIRIKKTI